MIRLGLTGSIASGKSTVLASFAALNLPVFSSDEAVHALYEGEAALVVEQLFPGVTTQGRVDRTALSRALVAAPQRLRELEAAIHPMVRRRLAAFFERAEKSGAIIAVADVPLLFETGFDYGLDAIAVTHAPDQVLRERALQRPGMSVEKLDAILARQLHQAEKLRRADYVIETDVPLAETEAAARTLIETLTAKVGKAMTREIVLDTETTGLNPAGGDRVVEIGGVELVNHIPTGRHFHKYVNPERMMTEDAFRVHGLSDEFLRDKPRFAEIAEDMLAFFADATLIAHNAPFDVSFLNAELEKLRRPGLRNTVIDTVELAREKHPGARVSLDALCKHYGIDNSRRTLHGALLDSQILADVYLELIGGRQVAFALIEETRSSAAVLVKPNYAAPRRPTPLPPRLDDEQVAAHLALIRTMGEVALWGYYADEAA